jgi:hypothetical protein
LENTVHGGIKCNNQSSPLITGNLVMKNTHSGNYGGGITCYEKSAPVINDNIIWANSGWGGGGINCSFSADPVITNNIIAGNKGNGAAGLYCFKSSPKVQNCMIGNNKGIGFRCEDYSSPTVSNCTVAGSSASIDGGGLYCWYYSSPTVTNTILWDNTAAGKAEIYTGYNSNPMITYCDIEGASKWPGTGNDNSDPKFVSGSTGDYHLKYTSPCRDKGTNSPAGGLLTTDFEGDPRKVNGTVDMGADEWDTHLYWTGDATPGGNVKIKFIGLPGLSVRLWIGSGVLDPPLKTPYGDWYLKFPLIADMVLGSMGNDGVLEMGFQFPLSTATPLTLPLQAGIGKTFTNLSIMEVE